jgi:hypothetical protein
MDALCLKYKYIDTSTIICDLDEEQKHQRYLELLGHSDDYKHVPFENWTCELFEKVRRQGQEKDAWGCPKYNETSLRIIASEHYNNKQYPYIEWGSLCPICFSPITNKLNAYLTKCSHFMHKTCITNYKSCAHDEYNDVHWGVHCPVCKLELERCMWLEKQYAFEPWGIENRRKSQCNLDYDFFKELLCGDTLECRGCSCTQGCGNIVGLTKSCKACQLWKHFTLKDLVYHKHKCIPRIHELKQERHVRKNMYCCTLLQGICHVTNIMMSFYKQRRPAILPYGY